MGNEFLGNTAVMVEYNKARAMFEMMRDEVSGLEHDNVRSLPAMTKHLVFYGTMMWLLEPVVKARGNFEEAVERTLAEVSSFLLEGSGFSGEDIDKACDKIEVDAYREVYSLLKEVSDATLNK